MSRRWAVLGDALARHIIIVIIVIVYNVCVFVTSGTYHIKITYSSWCSFYEITTGPDVGECKTIYGIGPTKKLKFVCKYVIQITIQNNDD
jgi:hypothetical protein